MIRAYRLERRMVGRSSCANSMVRSRRQPRAASCPSRNRATCPNRSGPQQPARPDRGRPGLARDPAEAPERSAHVGLVRGSEDASAASLRTRSPDAGAWRSPRAQVGHGCAMIHSGFCAGRDHARIASTRDPRWQPVPANVRMPRLSAPRPLLHRWHRPGGSCAGAGRARLGAWRRSARPRQQPLIDGTVDIGSSRRPRDVIEAMLAVLIPARRKLARRCGRLSRCGGASRPGQTPCVCGGSAGDLRSHD